MPGAAILTIDGSTTSSGPANPQDLNRFAYVTNNPLRFTDPTGHCGKATFGDTAISVMSGDCTRRAYEAFTRADTTEGKVVSGAVMVASAVGAGAGWAGGILLVAAGGQAIAGAVAGSTTASTAAGGAATAICADGDCTNEARLLDPKTIRFTQDSIRATFKNGSPVDSLISALKSGEITADDLPPIRVFERDGQLYSLDNRRLYAFQQAEQLIRTVQATADEIANEAWKFTTKNGGVSIRVRNQ